MLYVRNYILCTIHTLLSSIYNTLIHTTYYKLYIIYCIVYATYYILNTMHYTLYSVYAIYDGLCTIIYCRQIMYNESCVCSMWYVVLHCILLGNHDLPLLGEPPLSYYYILYTTY